MSDEKFNKLREAIEEHRKSCDPECVTTEDEMLWSVLDEFGKTDADRGQIPKGWQIARCGDGFTIIKPSGREGVHVDKNHAGNSIAADVLHDLALALLESECEQAAQVERLRKALYQKACAAMSEFQTSMDQTIDDFLPDEYYEAPATCLRETKAEAGRKGFWEGALWRTPAGGQMPGANEAADQYANQIRSGEHE